MLSQLSIAAALQTVYKFGDALRWTTQLARGLAYLHGHRPLIIHRDLKLENCLLTGAASLHLVLHVHLLPGTWPLVGAWSVAGRLWRGCALTAFCCSLQQHMHMRAPALDLY